MDERIFNNLHDRGSQESMKVSPPYSNDLVNCHIKIKLAAQNDLLSCASAFKLSEELGITRAETGDYADQLGLRLTKCRIGLFGYGKGIRLVKKLDKIDKKLEKKIKELSEDKKISCENLFKVAGELNTSLVEVGSACETAGIKITKCQLGAF